MNTRLFLALSLLFTVLSFRTYSQLKQVYKDTDEENDLRKISLYSKSEGYITFKNWIGFTTDGGASYQKKNITSSNVNFNGFPANLTFGFALTGTIAFDKNNLIVYGDYGLVPSILSSSDGGATFKLVYHAQVSDTKFSYMVDMVFPENGSIGYAIDQDRILKTSNKGQTWTTIYTSTDSYFKRIQAVGSSLLTVTGQDKIIRSTNQGSSWNQVNMPNQLAGNSIHSSTFLSPTKGWVNTAGGVFSTNDAGNNWMLQNNIQYDPVTFSRMEFLDNSIGFALGSDYKVFKTTNGGKNWEVLPRETDFTYLSYKHSTIHIWNSSEFLIGGDYGLLESTTNGGGTPIPKAIFSVDRSSLPSTSTINLVNHSKADYSYKWFKNDVLLATTYNASYQRTLSTTDIIRLEVSNDSQTESASQEITLSALPQISSFSPQSAGVGEKVTLEGTNFSRITKITVGETNSSFVINSATKLTITISAGASGDITLFTADGVIKTSGFIFIPPPVISSFSPVSALPGSEIVITGSNFENVKELRFGGTPASSFRVNSSTSITATVGDGTSGNISLIASGGKAELAGFILKPTINSFFPKSGTINEVITINGSGFEGVTAISVGGIPVKSFKINSSKLITAVIGESGNGDLLVSKPGGSYSMGSFTFYYAPTIISIFPQKAEVGTTIQIDGRNFSAVPAENIVYFGGVRTKVLSGNTTQLFVTVPVGAMYSNISVTTNQLTAYSSKFFSPVLSGNNVIANSAFKESDTEIGTRLHYGISAIGDFDGDGKVDCAIINTTYSEKLGFSILKSKSSPGSISFQESEIFGAGNYYSSVACADMDGDGKLDIITYVTDYGEISVFRNTSNAGMISFDAPIKISGIRLSILIAGDLLIGDLDKDGKPDLISGNIVIKNSSSVGAISFFDKIILPVDGGCKKIADLDNDGWMDLCFFNSSQSNFSILRNISKTGTIAFQEKKEYPQRITSLNCGDIDNDGKLDLVLVYSQRNMLMIYKNNSIAGEINFTKEQKEYATPYLPWSLGIADFDGDTKLDIVVSSNEKLISIFKNTSAGSSISFADRLDQELSTEIVDLKIADFDGDGKSDIIGGTREQTKFKTLRSLITTSPFISSFSPSVGIEGTDVTITGYNFNGVTRVKFGDTDAQSFTLRNPTEIVAKVAKGSSGELSITTLTGTGSKPGFSYGIAPKITSFSPQNGPSGTAVSITGLNFDPVAGNNIVFFGDVPAKVTSATAVALVVEAPRGSKQTNISVTTNNLTAYSAMPYINTYPGGTERFDQNAYAEPQKFPQSAVHVSLIDVDGDGILDLVTVQDGYFNIFRNTGIKGSVSFDPVKAYKNFASVPIAIADFDGDGRQDFLLKNSQINNVSSYSILRNTSTPGHISLDTKLDLKFDKSVIFTSDIDLDGKPDIVIQGNGVGVLRNISRSGEIKFEKPYYLPFIAYGYDNVAADFDNDGKIDLAAIDVNSNLVIQMRNTSLPGSIAFTEVAKIPVSSATFGLKAADLDDDGKIDLIVRDRNPNQLHIFKNTEGVLATSPTLSLPATNRSYDFTIADLDGDGKKDILSEGVSVFKNSSKGATISFQNEASYQNTEVGMTHIGDLDGDDRPDILFAGYPIRIYINQIGKAIPTITSFTPNKATLDQTINISGTNFTGTTSVQIGEFPAKSFVINSSNSITATLGSGGSGRITISTPHGIGVAENFEYIPQPIIGHLDRMVSSENYAFSIRGKGFTDATAVKFGGVSAQSFRVYDDNEINCVMGKGASGVIEVTTPIGTAKKEGFFYVPKAIIEASGPTTLPPGGSITLSINAVNNIKYQWYRSGILITGATSNSIQVSESGSYTVSGTYDNFGIWSDPIKVTALASLPTTNLKIRVVNESCKKTDDGLIEVIAMQALKYTAKLYMGSNLIKTTAFTQNTSFTNLGVGSYTVCITHEDDASYNKCFTVFITEPKDVVLTSSRVNSDNSVTLTMGGADLYFISLNGKSYQSNSGEINLPLTTGNNELKISTAKACQGIVEKKIILGGNIKAYPNPFHNELNIELPVDPKVPSVTIQVYDQLGNNVYKKMMLNTDGQLQLNLPFLPPGIYILRMLNGQNILQTKIIKK